MNQDRNVPEKKSLKDLKQKLNALDSLMHSCAKFGDLKRIDNSVSEKYSKSNPFTKNNKSIYNLNLN